MASQVEFPMVNNIPAQLITSDISNIETYDETRVIITYSIIDKYKEIFYEIESYPLVKDIKLNDIRTTKGIKYIQTNHPTLQKFYRIGWKCFNHDSETCGCKDVYTIASAIVSKS